MARRRPGILQTVRALNHDPLSIFRRIGLRDEFTLSRFILTNLATVSDPEIDHHILVTNTDISGKTPTSRSLLEPILGHASVSDTISA